MCFSIHSLNTLVTGRVYLYDVDSHKLEWLVALHGMKITQVFCGDPVSSVYHFLLTGYSLHCSQCPLILFAIDAGEVYYMQSSRKQLHRLYTPQPIATI